VAGVATALGMVSFVVIVLILNSLLINRMTSQVDQRLQVRLAIVENVLKQSSSTSATTIAPQPNDGDDDDAPIIVWLINANGRALVLSGAKPALPQQQWSKGYRTMTIATSTFRMEAVSYKSGWIVDAESLADVQRLRNTLELAELIAGLVLMILMFGAAFVVGIRALAPVSLAKRRQSEFVADASHELRTPLSVIEAEIDVALSRDREVAEYREALQRVKGESSRLRRIVEDLLWLARSDENLKRSRTLTPTDVASTASMSYQRFRSLATSNDVALSFSGSEETKAVIEGSDELIDRLVGVLVDNALKFAGPGGRVEITVVTREENVILRVDDSGPGVAPDERSRIFERFHHADSTQGGTGLGLAIAASIADITHCTYAVTDAEIGGARFEFQWRASGSEITN